MGKKYQNILCTKIPHKEKGNEKKRYIFDDLSIDANE